MLKQSTIDGINAALAHAEAKHGDQWMGALPLEQQGDDTIHLGARLVSLSLAADRIIHERPTRTAVLVSEAGESMLEVLRGNDFNARAELLQVAAMAAQWAQDLGGDAA